MVLVGIDDSSLQVNSPAQSDDLVWGWQLLGTVLQSSGKPGELLQRLCHDHCTINIVLGISISTSISIYKTTDPVDQAGWKIARLLRRLNTSPSTATLSAVCQLHAVHPRKPANSDSAHNSRYQHFQNSQFPHTSFRTPALLLYQHSTYKCVGFM